MFRSCRCTRTGRSLMEPTVPERPILRVLAKAGRKHL
jgi:hypothetical protein